MAATSGEEDLIRLYSGPILALAGNIPRTGRLDAPDATASRRAPLCGSTVTVDIRAGDGRITDYAQEVRACALGQAAASVVGANVVGCDFDQVRQARDQLERMLKQDGPAPAPPFDELEALRPARAFANRHESILLALNALVDAIDRLQQSGRAQG